MGPVPDEQEDNPADTDPADDELESPDHIIHPVDDSSDDDNGDFDSDAEGPPGDGYMLLPQDPEGEEGGGDTFQPQPYFIPTLPDDVLTTEPMTEVRGAGIDITDAVADGNVHPEFAAKFPDNKVPVHLQVPDAPKGKKEEVLWNHAPPVSERLQFDSAHLLKVKTAMAGFQLPKANIPDWARHIPEDQWKQQLVDKLVSPVLSPADRLGSHNHNKMSAAAVPDGSLTQAESSRKDVDKESDWPGTSGT